ncbi:hypothetical protein CEXT_718471 [Caerostris extrusa]|uniref:Uncharacterized protein n=1 Tax=Caerostris extrusa TaxID=172846 RepID=A0AAV4MQ57_CAEEX|nr:hypothetical protein CEXT_718471 [Caerostris extrusa]
MTIHITPTSLLLFVLQQDHRIGPMRLISVIVQCKNIAQAREERIGIWHHLQSPMRRRQEAKINLPSPEGQPYLK